MSSNDLRNHAVALGERIAAASRVCILSDFDGTLVPLEAQPDRPKLEGPSRRIVERLISLPRVSFGVISGRSLADLAARVDLPGIWLVGNHGYEVRDPRGGEQRSYGPEDVQVLTDLRDEMEEALEGIPGVLLEPKGPILAVHYRGVDESRTPDVERLFLAVMERHRHRLMMARGKMVLEARLRGGPNKGRAVRHIRYELPAAALVLYFGDDLTDRDAFRELKGTGMSVEVGGDETSLADYTLPDPSTVLGMLDQIREEMEAASIPGTRVRRRRLS